MRIAIEGRLGELSARQRTHLLERRADDAEDVRAATATILARVRAAGDRALEDLARRFDRVDLERLEIAPERWRDAPAALAPGVRRALERASANVEAFHRMQLPADVTLDVEPGVRLGRCFVPLDAVGVYAPGGRARYPSSVLMGVVPARVAGVREIVVCSPPGPDGLPPLEVRAAAAIGGAHRLFAVGGAGAVAALAYGTESVPRCAAVVGPGNRWVLEAKRQVAGEVRIDAPAGPSEVLIVADESADPDRIAVELVAQAEHDPHAAAVLVTTSPDLEVLVRASLAKRVAAATRRDVIEPALARHGALLLADRHDEALEFAREYAPEHLALYTSDPRRDLERVRSAGTAFLGDASSVAFGDYLTGANHVLPTAGAARSFSGLGTLDFLRSFTWQEITPAGAAALADDTATLAEAEGLPAHARAAHLRSASQTLATRPSMGPTPIPAVRYPRADYVGLTRHSANRRPVEVDLSDNTNLWGAHPAALAAVRAADVDALARYPALYADDLRETAAARFGTGPDEVATGCGSDDVLDSTWRAVAEHGGRVSFAAPTFSMIEPFTRMNGRIPDHIPWSRVLDDPARLLVGDPVLVYVCRPNNPTGHLAGRPWVDALLRAAGHDGPIIVFDEAYAEFAGESLVERVLAHPRALVVRTLSKAYGLAGLRVGLGLANATLVTEIEKSRGPYKVGRLAEAAAVAALADTENWVGRTVRECVTNRERLRAELEARGLPALESWANFLLVPVGAGSARNLAEALRGRGVGVRPFPACPDIGDAVRVSVGPWPLLERFLHALDRVLERGRPGEPT